MNKIIVTMLLILTGSLTTQLTHARGSLREGQARFSRLPIELVDKATQADGFETFDGDRFALEEIQTISNFQKEALPVLQQDIIELRDGTIYYPEEVEYALTRDKEEGNLRLNRAPITAD